MKAPVVHCQRLPGDLSGELENDTWQVLPKLALQYNHRSGRGNVYVAVSKGYRSGGYNIQSYSDLSQTQLQRNMMLGIKEEVIWKRSFCTESPFASI